MTEQAISTLVKRAFEDRTVPNDGDLPADASLEDRFATTLRIVLLYTGLEGAHHKDWVLDQAMRALTGPSYEEFVRRVCEGARGPDTYAWNTGIEP